MHSMLLTIQRKERYNHAIPKAMTGKRAAGRTPLREFRMLGSEQADAREFLPGAALEGLQKAW